MLFKYFLEKYNYIETESEKKYENLEPWIQWVSFYSGKTYEEHKQMIIKIGLNK